jgi:hypothetical protein
MGKKVVIHQIADVGVAEKDQIASIAPIAPIGAASGNIFFPAKTQTTMAAIPGF